ncbi:MAG: inositol-3-phosphate synthase [Thermoprotei archaeon]
MLGKVKVAIAGVGNCASALVQGVYYYRKADENSFVPGLLHVKFGPYHVSDIEFVAAFDVDERKIGKDLSEAIFTPPNNTRHFSEVPKLGVEVMRAPVLDGIGKYLKDVIKINPHSKYVDVADVLKSVGADVLINYVPVGSENAARWYAQQSLDASVAFANAMPVFIASDPKWQRKFRKKGLPVAGDDVQSQIGSTVLHKTLVRLLVNRGVKILRTYQLNFGGDTDFLNMLERERLKSKEISKTSAVTSMVPYSFDVKIGPSDYVPFLKNKKIAHIMIEGVYFGDTPVTIDVKLDVWDAPNSAGVMIDVVRAIKIARDRGIGGPLISISSYAFKHPPVHAPADQAVKWVEDFIKGKRKR